MQLIVSDGRVRSRVAVRRVWDDGADVGGLPSALSQPDRERDGVHAPSVTPAGSELRMRAYPAIVEEVLKINSFNKQPGLVQSSRLNPPPSRR